LFELAFKSRLHCASCHGVAGVTAVWLREPGAGMVRMFISGMASAAVVLFFGFMSRVITSAEGLGEGHGEGHQQYQHECD
jgi:hypothetical protein